MESDASTSPRRSDSSDSSTCSDGDDLLSSSSPKGTGIHRLPPLPCATDGAIAALVEELESPASSLDDLRRAAMELRLLAKHSPDNRLRIVAAGALPPLVALLSRPDPLLQEHGVTALLNLSLRKDNRGAVVDAGAVGPLVRALRSAASPAARENAACALLRLAQLDGSAAAAIGRAGAVPVLVSLLESGGARGKKDAATALYALCSGAPEENGPRAVEAGAVRALLELMGEPERGMVEKAAYVLHALVGTAEGRAAAVAEGGVPVLVEMVEGGTPRHKEMATLCLLHVCEDSAAYRTMVAREGAIPPLVALSHSSDARPKLRAKAEVLVGLLRQPRSGSLLRARPSVAASRLPAGLCN
ncbi:U-box domain-containing protein 4-like [Oryza glaberrima]|uniref:U-box domain-containing protein 4-like n=1 Tax=Oryza glaberrima TaxID=4538 RepID=UPI00224BEBB8|nr:U-box domain-containing protein 4-like [Oryza glaberrima]